VFTREDEEKRGGGRKLRPKVARVRSGGGLKSWRG